MYILRHKTHNQFYKLEMCKQNYIQNSVPLLLTNSLISENFYLKSKLYTTHYNSEIVKTTEQNQFYI